jgi:16S rRNA (uracil1498-N3)-methyltransferase
MNIVLLSEEDLHPAGARVSGRRAQHVLRVLRLGRGDELRVGLLNGPLGVARIESCDEDSLELSLCWHEAPPRPRVHVLLAVPRPKVLGRLYSPLAQLGIARLILTHASKVERPYFDAHQVAPEYAHEQLLEGLSQARDTWLPRVTIHRSFRRLIEDELDELLPADCARALMDPGQGPSVRELSAHARDLALAVGPEGGWNDFERELLVAHGFLPHTLGPRVLRTDVALLAMLGAIGAP